MNLLSKLKERNYQIAVISVALAIVLALWKPHVLVEGIQRACLYAVIALPMALILGIVGIINLAHGDFMMLGAYFVISSTSIPAWILWSPSSLPS